MYQSLYKFSVLVFASSLFIGCGGGGSSDKNVTSGVSSHLDTSSPIDSQYVNHTLQTAFADHFTQSGTFVAHKDARKGNKVDIQKVVISIAENATYDPQLVFGFDALILQSLPSGTVPALYIDTDNGATGVAIGDIKADILLVEAGTSDANNVKPTFGLWTTNGSTWAAGSSETLLKHYSHVESSSLLTKFVILPVSSNTDATIFTPHAGNDVKAILALRAFSNGNVDQVKSTSDQTDSFVFTMPTP